MPIWKDRGFKCATIVLSVLSVISVVSTFGVGFAAVVVGGERTKRNNTSPYLYTVLTTATAHTAVSSFLVTVTVAIALYRLTHKEESGRDERSDSQAVMETAFEMSQPIILSEISVGETSEDGQTPAVGSHATEWQQYYQLQPLTPIGCILLFTGVLFGQWAILLVLWVKGYATQAATEDASEIPFAAFQLTAVMAGIVAPILMLIAVLIITLVIDYTSFGRVDARGVIPYILPSVQMFKTAESSYWVIADRFYFRTRKKRPQSNQEGHIWLSTCDRSVVTWGLAAIVSIAFVEGAATFAHLILSEMVTYDSCEAVDVDTKTFSCYVAGSWQYINCSKANISDSSHLRCFRFKSSVAVADMLQALVSSYVVYNVVLQIFQLSFGIVEALLRCQPTRLWGALLVLGGILLTIVGATAFVFGFLYPMKYKYVFLFQITLLGVSIIVTGALILMIKWEKEDEEEGIELVSSYHNLPSKRISGVSSGQD